MTAEARRAGARGMVLTGIAAVTPHGDTLDEALAAGRRAVAPNGWFNVKARLGKHGYKYLPPACQYLLAAARGALADAGDCLEGVAPEERAVAVGINGAASALQADMDRTIVSNSTDALSPIGAPFFSINLFSSRLSIEHNLKGFNLTTMSPRVAALEALEIGLRCVGIGRASWLLAGAAEAPLDADEPAAEQSECGAVALVFESAATALKRKARIYGRFAVRTSFLAPALAEGRRGRERAAQVLDEGMRALGLAAGVASPGTVAIVDDSPVGLAIASALGPGTQCIAARAGCLEPLVRAAGLTVAGERERTLVTAAAEGNIAIVRLTPAEWLESSGREMGPAARSEVDASESASGSVIASAAKVDVRIA